MKVVLHAFVVLAFAGAAFAQSARKPNVIFILVDDMGYADLSSFGSKDIRTPNIDRLAKEGVKLTRQDRTLCWRIDRAGFRQQAIRSGKWKLVTQPTSVDRLLFDLERDPGERRNLFYEHQDKAKELHARLTAWDKEMNQSQPRFSVK